MVLERPSLLGAEIAVEIAGEVGRRGMHSPSEEGPSHASSLTAPSAKTVRAAELPAKAARERGLSSFASVRSLRVETEEVLIERARSGEREAFEELVRRHTDHLFAVTLRFLGDRADAEEATQEAFLRAWRSIGRFERRSKFFTWLYRIGLNEANRLAARRAAVRKTRSLDEEPIPDAPDWSEAPEARLGQGEVRRVLEDAISDLPPDHRAPLVLRDVEGLSTAEAAQVMDLSEGAFKSRLHRARLAVRRALDEYFLDMEE
jgi:RNA polymerase sigma-70 factor, ECF subfamily